MKTLGFVLLYVVQWSSIFPDSTFFVEFDQVHRTVLKQFILENEQRGMLKERSILIVKASTPALSSNQHEWSIFGAERGETLKRETPNYISEVDGYAVAFYAQDVSSYIQYPKAYLDKIDKRLRSKLVKKPKRIVVKTRYVNGKPPETISTEVDDPPFENFSNWRVIFKSGEEPVILRTL